MNEKTRIDRRVAWFTAFSAAATFLGVIASGYFVNRQIQESREEARALLGHTMDAEKIQHLVDETARFDQQQLLAARRELAEARIDRNRERLRRLDIDNPPDQLWDVLNACDHIGLLTRRGYLDVSDVWNEMGYWLLNIYSDAEPLVKDDQKTNPASMANCSWLIDQMRPIEASQNAGADLHPSEEQLYSFYVGEATAKPRQGERRTSGR